MMKNTMLEMSRYAALARQAVAEGIVLLKNEAVLPLASGGRAALFGYAQFHYYQSGTGSGGLVNTAHVPNLPEVLGGPDGYQLDAEVQARSIMTSYNPLNGYWTASNYDLVTTILRGQWCYTGIVMSDWWADGNDRDGAGSTKHVAAMVRAQNDVFMVVTDPEHNSGSDDLAAALTEGRLIRGELQRSAANICRFLLQTPAFRRSIGCTTALDAQLEAMAEQNMQQAAQNGQPLTLHGGVSIDPAAIDNGYRRTTAFCVMVEQGGAYTLHLRCRAMLGNSPLAQIPVSIFAGRVFVKTITITGAQTDWCEFTAALPAVDAGKTFYLRFYFGQSGMELDAVTLDLLS